MGFDLNAFLGRASELRLWKGELSSAVVCDLSGDLGLVPVTRKLFQELRTRLTEEEANRLDAAQGCSTYPSASHSEAARRWGSEASRGTAIAYVSLGEFGDFGYDNAILWSDGKERLSRGNLKAVLEHFRGQMRFDLGDEPIDLEKHRGEEAAEKWAATATQQGQGNG
jgi:hypothetical protein